VLIYQAYFKYLLMYVNYSLAKKRFQGHIHKGVNNMNLLLSIVASALISGVFLYCLLNFGLKNGKLNWKYSWLVLGIVLPWFYFLTDSIHIALPGGAALDLRFRDAPEKKPEKSGLLHAPPPVRDGPGLRWGPSRGDVRGNKC